MQNQSEIRLLFENDTREEFSKLSIDESHWSEFKNQIMHFAIANSNQHNDYCSRAIEILIQVQRQHPRKQRLCLTKFIRSALESNKSHAFETLYERSQPERFYSSDDVFSNENFLLFRHADTDQKLMSDFLSKETSLEPEIFCLLIEKMILNRNEMLRDSKSFKETILFRMIDYFCERDVSSWQAFFSTFRAALNVFSQRFNKVYDRNILNLCIDKIRKRPTETQAEVEWQLDIVDWWQERPLSMQLLDIKKNYIGEILLSACRVCVAPELLERFLCSDNIDVNYKNGRALAIASEVGNLKHVQVLLSSACQYSSRDDCESIEQSSKRRKFSSLLDSEHCWKESVVQASKNNRIDIVEFFMRSKPRETLECMMQSIQKYDRSKSVAKRSKN